MLVQVENFRCSPAGLKIILLKGPIGAVVYHAFQCFFYSFLEADVKSTTKVIDAATWHK